MAISKDILDYLGRVGGARTMAEIRETVRPGAKAAEMHAHLSSLVKRGKVRREGNGKRGGATFSVIAGAPIDRRYTRPKPLRVVTVIANPTHGPMDVAADIDTFLGAGGNIERLERHACSRPFKHIGGAR